VKRRDLVMKEGGGKGNFKEISKCEERTFTCPHCDGEGLVGSGWYPDREVIVYTGSKHECSQCKGTGKKKSK
jgi:DnaJ-class molecular chaperone